MDTLSTFPFPLETDLDPDLFKPISQIMISLSRPIWNPDDMFMVRREWRPEFG